MFEPSSKKTCADAPSGQLLQGLREFNGGQWYDCHETVEDIWIGSRGEVKHLLQGIIQVAVALHHWQNGNYIGAVGLLETGVEYLSCAPQGCMWIDVQGLIEQANRFRQALVTGGQEHMHRIDRSLIPQIKTKDVA